MVEFGDEFIIETYKIPWLIWIQLLVTILLILFLFFGFAAFNSHPSSTSSTVEPPSDAAAPPHPDNNPTSSSTIIKVEDERARRDAGNPGGEDDETGDGSSVKNSVFEGIFGHPNHPCNYFGLAKQAIFKCFGLDSSSSNHEHEKHE